MYRVYNNKNVLVKITDQQLDEAAHEQGPLSTELANAAGLARRHNLAKRLSATLESKDRMAKLAAARALLTLGEGSAIIPLLKRAKTEKEPIVANVLHAIALRLESVEALRKAFDSGDKDPALAGAIASVYNGTFDFTTEDLDFLLDMTDAYLSNAATWIANTNHDEWQSDLDIIISTIAEGVKLISDQERARTILKKIGVSRAESETKQTAKRLLAEL